MGKPKKNLTFKCYCSKLFISQVKEHDSDYSSGITDVVFDTYKEKCLKGASKTKKKCTSESTIKIFYDWGKRKLNLSTTFQQKKYQKGRIKVSQCLYSMIFVCRLLTRSHATTSKPIFASFSTIQTWRLNAIPQL